MVYYKTILEALNELRQGGYTIDFNLRTNRLLPDSFGITGVYRFEGQTNPDDEAVVYAIESRDGNLKGLLVNSYGAFSDSRCDDIIKDLSIRR